VHGIAAGAALVALLAKRDDIQVASLEKYGRL
jgi:hypothetical protein